MCTNGTFKCLLSHNESMLSEAYFGKQKTSSFKLNEIKIIFKNRLKLMTGIDANTTFEDLKMALLISKNESKPSSKSQKSKSLNHKEYVICESVNNVEKVIDSSSNVQSELKRIHQESMLLEDDFKIFHIMRLKASLKRLPCQAAKKRSSEKSKKHKHEVPILTEFYPRDYSLLCSPEQQSKKAKTTSKKEKDIEKALVKFDVFIDERKNYIKLLEEYLDLLENMDVTKETEETTIINLEVDEHYAESETESDFNETDHTYAIARLQVKDSDSNDTGFNSSESDSVSSLCFSSPELNCLYNESKAYFTRSNKFVSNFETFV